MASTVWHTLSPEGKAQACISAYNDGANTADEIAEIVGTTKGAVIGLLARQKIDVLHSDRARSVKARRKRVRSENARAKNRATQAKENAKAALTAASPVKSEAPQAVQQCSPSKLPEPGDGISMDEAIAKNGCRYIIGDIVTGHPIEMCGQPIKPDQNYRFCTRCLPKLTNTRADAAQRQAANA